MRTRHIIGNDKRCTECDELIEMDTKTSCPDPYNDNKPFPIQSGESYRDHKRRIRYSSSSTIPWWLAKKAYEYYSKRFGTSQSLERLAERGGFGREELIAFLREELPGK